MVFLAELPGDRVRRLRGHRDGGLLAGLMLAPDTGRSMSSAGSPPRSSSAAITAAAIP
ncbi:hypothetical protein [Wenjunlia tyrosinilytica]|uniref:hypothetical protein n=1 Tax=Wenjunlia tyrosinilytica TaxID=1544741 RepID=UPI00166ED3DD|nr:hypothetical protein [Wenjunlia tyrosinilytica]